jgi:hypothetical protein
MACVMNFVYAAPLFRVLDWLWTKAAWTTAFRSGLGVTAAIGVVPSRVVLEMLMTHPAQLP